MLFLPMPKQFKKRQNCLYCNRQLTKHKIDFCNDYCRFKYIPPSEEPYDADACFNLVAAAIEHAFIFKNEHSEEDDREFIKSNLVKMWCDCSSNFHHDKLLKAYEETILSPVKNINRHHY